MLIRPIKQHIINGKLNKCQNNKMIITIRKSKLMLKILVNNSSLYEYEKALSKFLNIYLFSNIE